MLIHHWSGQCSQHLAAIQAKKNSKAYSYNYLSPEPGTTILIINTPIQLAITVEKNSTCHSSVICFSVKTAATFVVGYGKYAVRGLQVQLSSELPTYL
jgi:hypothetical protein